MSKTAQEWADETVDPRYRQPLKTIEEACQTLGWEAVDRPECCGQLVELWGFLGCCDGAACKTCGKFIARTTAPRFGNAWVSLPTAEEISDLDDPAERFWICGVTEPENV